MCQNKNFGRKIHSVVLRAAGGRERRCEEIRKFGKSFGLRFTAWIRLSARHFADDESTTLVQELLLRIRDDTTKPKDGYARGRRDSEIRIRKDSSVLLFLFILSR